MITSTSAILRGGTHKTKGTMKRENINISVQTLPNGYALTVDDQEYMYFNTRELLEGLFYHVGLEKTGYMDRQTIHDLMFAAATWPDAKDAVKDALRLTAENSRLTKEVGGLKHKIGKLMDTNDSLQDQLKDFMKKPKKSSNKNPTRADAAPSQKPVNLVTKAIGIGSHITRGEAGPLPEKKHIKVSTTKKPLSPADPEKVYQLLMTPIRQLKLPTRVKSALIIVGGKENKIVGDAVRYSREEFMKVRGCGNSVMMTLDAWLMANHIDFGYDVEGALFAHAQKSATV